MLLSAVLEVSFRFNFFQVMNACILVTASNELVTKKIVIKKPGSACMRTNGLTRKREQGGKRGEKEEGEEVLFYVC